MIDSGIVSQYGFLYQRMVFLLYVLQNISVKKVFTFEGKDDVEISKTDQIFSIFDITETCIQVKSGEVSEASFSKVICNWMLLDDYTKYSFELVAENDLVFDVSDDERANNIYKYIIEGKDKNRSAIARKTYDKYITSNKQHKEALIETIKKVLCNFKLTVHSVDEIRSLAKDLFEQSYCSDILSYDIARVKRFERFEAYLNSKIDDSIKSKKKYSLIYSDFIKIIMQVTDEISEHRYTVDLRPLKKKLEPIAKKIVDAKKLREVDQLSRVDTDERFIIDNIVCELIYKDFRSVYEQERKIDVSNWEQDAWENFDASKYSLGKDSNTPKNLYMRTVEKQIESQLLPKGTIYSKGCYVYLSGIDIEEDIQITWGDDNEAR